MLLPDWQKYGCIHDWVAMLRHFECNKCSKKVAVKGDLYQGNSNSTSECKYVSTTTL